MISLEKETRLLLSRHNIKTKKYLGQNFLVDVEVLREIFEASHLSPQDFVLEIGAGLGILTREIAGRAKKVFALEIDDALVKVLRIQVSSCKNVEIIKKDVLKTDLAALFPKGASIKVIANLPYYITTPVILHLLKQNFPPLTQFLLMVQKEVGLRLAASPGNRDYGIFSIVVQYCAKPELISVIHRKAFLPSPGVDSALVRITLLKTPSVKVKDEVLFFAVVRASFGQRRKMLPNALLKSRLGLTREVVAEMLAESRIDPTRRAESLSLQEFARLSDKLFAMKRDKKWN